MGIKWLLSDGNWATWNQWTACDAACGTGKETRNRDCALPTPPGVAVCTTEGTGNEERTCQAAQLSCAPTTGNDMKFHD